MTEKTTVLAKIVILVLVAAGIQLFLPWWSIALAAIAVEFLGKNRPLWSFYAGFYGISTLWICYAFFMDYRNSHILSHRMVKMFMLPDIPILIIILTGLLGGFVGGLAAISANYFKSLFQTNEYS
jgi:hypothetical protein